MTHVDVLIERYPELESQRENILEAYEILEESYANGGKLLIAGNGKRFCARKTALSRILQLITRCFCILSP